MFIGQLLFPQVDFRIGGEALEKALPSRIDDSLRNKLESIAVIEAQFVLNKVLKGIIHLLGLVISHRNHTHLVFGVEQFFKVYYGSQRVMRQSVSWIMIAVRREEIASMDETIFRYSGQFVRLLSIGPRYAVVQPIESDYQNERISAESPAQHAVRVEWIFPVTPRPAEPEDYRLERMDSLPFETCVDLATLRHAEDITASWNEAYLARMRVDPLPLTDGQMAFMLSHHGEIERAAFYRDFLDFMPSETWEPQILGDVIPQSAFREVFGTMSWDDAYDRYEDSSTYDAFFKALLHYTDALAHGLSGWALRVHEASYDPTLLQALRQFQDLYPTVLTGLIANAPRLKSSLPGAPDYDANLDTFYQDAAEKAHRFRTDERRE